MIVAAGVAVEDITPPAGVAMAGFAARTEPALGTHDPLTARALVVGDTALVVADVIGIEAAMAQRIRAASGLDPDRVIVAATHTHGGPSSMAGRILVPTDPATLARIEAGCIAALHRAAADRAPARLSAGAARDPGIARNRRHTDGPVDRTIPVLRLDRPDGSPLAVVTSWACHPVVLDATNRLWTGDWPHFLRRGIEAALPGAVAISLTGTCGDVNIGHSAQASVSLATDPRRTFAEAERIGVAIAAEVLRATLDPVADAGVAAAARTCDLPLRPADPAAAAHLAAGWAAEAPSDPARRALLAVWSDWARHIAPRRADPVPACVTALRWGDAAILGLPGEIFASQGLALRAHWPGLLAPVTFAEDNPGYICPSPEFPHGGYEVVEAHRYYGQPSGFAEGAAERLADTAFRALQSIAP